MAGREMIISEQDISRAIYFLRGERVMIDEDLAQLFGVTTKRLNEQVKRNLDRFPEDFMFQLTKDEWETLKPKFAQARINPAGRGGRRIPPHAFTEHGTIMLANVLNSKRAVAVSVQVVRVFIKMRKELAQRDGLSRKLAQLDRRVSGHDDEIKAIIQAIRQLMEPPKNKKREIGFGK